MKRKRILVTSAVVFILFTGCATDNITPVSSVPTQTTPTQSTPPQSSMAENSEELKEYIPPYGTADHEIGERILYPAMINTNSNGEFYVTVNSVKCYRNVYDAGIRFEDLSTGYQAHYAYAYAKRNEESYWADREMDRETGEVRKSADGSERVFILLDITFENIDAKAAFADEKHCEQMIELHPEVYGDHYVDPYDFAPEAFPGVIPVCPPDAPHTYYGGPKVYFSTKGEKYPASPVPSAENYLTAETDGRENRFELLPGEKKTVQIGQFVFWRFSKESGIYEPDIGQDLMPRLAVMLQKGLPDLIQLHLTQDDII